MEQTATTTTTTNMEETHLIEITLISAQCLKPPSTNLRRLQTYAVSWVDPAFKLRTQIDRVGGPNPTWNDKFFFRVSSAFLSTTTSAVTVEIFSVGYLKDPLIGSVRFLIANALSSSTTGTIPSFSAFQIRRPSGRFHGVLNIGAMLINGSNNFASAFPGAPAIGYRDLMGENRRRRRRPVAGEEFHSCENSSCGDAAESNSDADSSCSSTSTRSSVLRDWNWNGKREMAGKKARILCGLGFQRKIHESPSDENLHTSQDG